MERTITRKEQIKAARKVKNDLAVQLLSYDMKSGTPEYKAIHARLVEAREALVKLEGMSEQDKMAERMRKAKEKGLKAKPKKATKNKKK